MSWYGLSQKPITFPQPFITTTSLPPATVGLAYGAGLVTNIFTQPNVTDGIAAHFIQGTPPVGKWMIRPLQASIYGAYVATSFDMSSFTGFAPNNPGNSQMSARNVAGASTAQMEGLTVGAYINTADIAAGSGKMMITPTFAFSSVYFPFANNQSMTCSLNLTVPTATGVTGQVPPVYIRLDMLFNDPAGVPVTYDMGFFRQGSAGHATTFTIDAGATGDYIIGSTIGFDSLYGTISPGSAPFQTTTYTTAKTFSFTISAAQFAAALQQIALAFPSGANQFTGSLDPSQYQFIQQHLNAEIQTQGGAGPYALGWSMSGLSITDSGGGGGGVGLGGSGGYPPYSWAFLQDTPNTGNWLKLSSSGLLTGTPGTAETENLTVQLTDSTGNPSPPQSLTLTVQGGLVITNSSLPNAVIGQAYSAPLAVTGGTPPYIWSLVSANPDTGNWLSVSGSNLVGTPGTAETESVTVHVADSGGSGLTAQTTLSLLVTSPVITKNWHPGHYISLPRGDIQSPATFATRKPIYDSIFALCPASVKGILLWYPWGKFETSFGVYNLSDIAQDLTYLAQKGKVLALEILERFFSNSPFHGPITTDWIPGYLTNPADPHYSNTYSATGVAGDPGYVTNRSPGGTDLAGTQWTAPAHFIPAVQARFNAAITAILQSTPITVNGVNYPNLASVPNFEYLGVCDESIATSAGSWGGNYPSYSAANWDAAMKSYWTTLALNSGLNFPAACWNFNMVNTVAGTTSMGNVAMANQMGFTGPDIITAGTITIDGNPYSFSNAYAYYLGQAPGFSGTGQIGKLPAMWQVQSPDFPANGSPSTTLTNTLNYANNTLHSTHIAWAYETGTSDGSDFTSSLGPFLNANAITNTTYPTSFPGSLNITTTTVPNATVASAYSQTIAATGGTPPYTWSLQSASPNWLNWLSINASTGVISGTPPMVETETIVVKVTDSAANTDTQNLTLTVNHA